MSEDIGAPRSDPGLNMILAFCQGCCPGHRRELGETAQQTVLVTLAVPQSIHAVLHSVLDCALGTPDPSLQTCPKLVYKSLPGTFNTLLFL